MEKMLVTSTMFSSLSQKNFATLARFKLSPANAWNLEKSNIPLFGKKLKTQII